jgi:predicted transcriptional regulator
MRTTISIDDSLLAKAKRVAAETGRSLSAVIDDALQESLNRRGEDARQATEVVLPSFEGRLLPGTDLDNSAALRDIMDDLG